MEVLFSQLLFAWCPGLHILPLARSVLMTARFHYDVIPFQDAFGGPFYLGQSHEPLWQACSDLPGHNYI